MAEPVKMQRLSKFAETSEVLEWLKSPGETVQEGEPLVTVLSDKATVEVPAPASGVLLKVVVGTGDQVPAGTVLAWIGQPGEELEEEGATVVQPAELAGGSATGKVLAASGEPASALHGRLKAAPAARRLAAEHGIPLADLTGSGPGGMVTVADVEKALAQRQAQQPQPAASDLGERRPEPLAGERLTTVLPLQGFRRAMAQRMTASHQAIVQGTTVVDVDMTETVRLRERVPVSLTAFVIKAAAQAALEFPLVNASLEEDAIVLKKQVDMGVAVATEEGLLVPVVRRAETQSLTQIHRELEELAQRARDRALTAEELSNPSMTVTNSGVFGSLLFLPIVVLPQSVTLGMGKVASTPVVRAGQIVARDIMYLSLGYDHRFLDGAIAVRYLQRVKGFLEEPTLLV